MRLLPTGESGSYCAEDIELFENPSKLLARGAAQVELWVSWKCRFLQEFNGVAQGGKGSRLRTESDSDQHTRGDLTRAALSTSGRAKSKFLSVIPTTPSQRRFGLEFDRLPKTSHSRRAFKFKKANVQYWTKTCQDQTGKTLNQRFRLFGLSICFLLVACNKDSPQDSKQTTESVETVSEPNSLPTLPHVVLEKAQPNLVDTILQAAGSHAQVSFVTNSEGVECTFTSPDREDRLRVQAVVTRMLGSCKGTLDPPTVIFRLQPVPMYPPAVNARVSSHGSYDDINVRLQKRWDYEKARDAREIHDLEAEIAADETALLSIGNRAVAFNRAEILRAKKSRLSDLRDFYLTKYRENP